MKKQLAVAAAAAMAIGAVAATASASDDTGDGDDGWIEVETDIGVDDETIKVGMLADLSGTFAPLVVEIVAAQEVYWDAVNRDGGIAGRQVELIVEDNAYDIPTHLEKYDAIRDEVAIISQSTGSPHTTAIAEDLVADDLVAVALTWYSGWPDPDFGQNVFESYTNYCYESMNALEWLQANRGVETVAIVSFPGEYGEDGAVGAHMAAEELGLEVVYDGQGQVTPPTPANPSPDWSGVIQQIVDSDADLVWTTINPGSLAAIMGGAIGQGFEGIWSGNAPSYSFKLLGTDAGPLFDQYYIASNYIVTWGADVPGMERLMEEMTAARPDLEVSDVYVLGWTEAQMAHQILEHAAASGDMTRAGILAAANEVEVDYEGLAPDQTWAGDPNDYIVRESYLYEISLEDYNPVTLGEGGGSTGTVLLEGPYVGEVAGNHVYEGACFEPAG